jgi:glycosyltransferase involved in cell wall biosynthesis
VEAVHKLNRRLATRQILRAARRLSFTAPVLWLCETENAFSLRQAAPGAPCIFQAIDYQDRERDAKAAVDLAAASQLVIASSELILRSLRVADRPCCILPNAWTPWPNPMLTRLPPELTSVPRPYIGFVGSLGPTLDFELLNGIAERIRASLIVVGERTAPLSKEDGVALKKLRSKENVHFLGWRPTTSLAQYIAAFDVCLAPYKQGPRVYASSPLKPFQYLSLGKPVVATPVAQLEGLEPLIVVAPDRNSFVEAVREALERTEDPDILRRRRAYAASNTWEVRWRTLKEVLQSVPSLRDLAG